MTVRKPIEYLRTGKAVFLIILKFLEAALAGFVVVSYLTNKELILESVQKNLYIYQLLGAEDAYRTYIDVIFALCVGDAALMILEGISCISIKRGSSIIALCHLIRCAFLAVLILVSAVGFVSRLSGTYMRKNSVLFLAIAPAYITSRIEYFIVFAARVFGLYLLASYQFSVYRMMWHVSKEIKADRILAFGVPRYRITRISYLMLIIILLDLVLGYNMGSILSEHALWTDPIYFIFTGLPIVSGVILAFLVIKFYLAGRCAVDFEEVHGVSGASENREAAQSRALFVQSEPVAVNDPNLAAAWEEAVQKHNTPALVQLNYQKRWTTYFAARREFVDHQTWMKNHEDGKQLYLFAEYIESMDDFMGQTINNAVMSHCIFYKLDLTKTVFQDCDLSYSQFVGCKTKNTSFPGSNMEGVTFV